VLVEIDQSESRQQPCVILLQAAIANFGVLEDALQDAKGHSTSLLLLTCAVLVTLFFVRAVFGFGAAIGHVLALAQPRGSPSFALITRVAQTFFSSPCSRSGSMCESCTEAAEVHTE